MRCISNPPFHLPQKDTRRSNVRDACSRPKFIDCVYPFSPHLLLATCEKAMEPRCNHYHDCGQVSKIPFRWLSSILEGSPIYLESSLNPCREQQCCAGKPKDQ